MPGKTQDQAKNQISNQTDNQIKDQPEDLPEDQSKGQPEDQSKDWLKDRAGNRRYRLLIIAILLLDIIAIGLIPINLFWFNMQEYITVIISAAVFLLNVLLWFQHKPKKTVKTVISLFSIAAALFTLFGAYCNPYWNSLSFRSNYTFYVRDDNLTLTGKEALADFDYAMKYLQKLHPALYHGMPEEVEAQYTLSRQRLESCETVDLCTLAQEIESVFALLGDAHTHASANYGEQHFLKYIDSHNRAGDILTKINGMTMEELFQNNSHLISYEAESWGITWVYDYVSSVEGLRYLGINVEDGVEFTYEGEKGQESSYTYTKDDFVTYGEYVEFNRIESSSQEQTSFVYYEIDVEHNVAVLTLNSCNNNAEYRECLRNMFQEIKDKGIQNVAVDLRDNGGGDSSVANEFFRYLDIDGYREWADIWRLGLFQIKHNARIIENDRYEELVFDGNLYLLTSVYTFSSAMDFAEYVKDNQLGIIIGEASGNNPSSYGDISIFSLPRSGIFMQISTKKWYRIDENLEHQLIEPDVPCDAWRAKECLYRELAEQGK